MVIKTVVAENYRQEKPENVQTRNQVREMSKN